MENIRPQGYIDTQQVLSMQLSQPVAMSPQRVPSPVPCLPHSAHWHRISLVPGPVGSICSSKKAIRSGAIAQTVLPAYRRKDISHDFIPLRIWSCMFSVSICGHSPFGSGDLVPSIKPFRYRLVVPDDTFNWHGRASNPTLRTVNAPQVWQNNIHLRQASECEWWIALPLMHRPRACLRKNHALHWMHSRW